MLCPHNVYILGTTHRGTDEASMLGMRLSDQEDWDNLQEDIVPCPQCQHKVRIYWSPTRHEYLLLGFFCHHCDAPYQDLFQTASTH